MSLIDGILLVLIAAILFLAIRGMRKHKGCSCGQCSSETCHCCDRKQS